MAGTDKMREEFEAWALANPDMTRATHFDVWKASREALVIELPYVHCYPANEAASDQDYYIDEAKADILHQCKKAIEAAGLKVK